MTSCLRSLVLSAVLCAQLSHLCCPLHASELTLVKNAVLSEIEKSQRQGDSPADEPPFFRLAPEVLSAMESQQKRMLIKNKYRIQTQRGRLYQNSGKTHRWSKFTLSLDVPTHLMNVLFDIAKTKHLQAKAEDNARLLALIGKRK